MTQQIPKIVFIVPYRNRLQQKFFFSNYLTSILDLYLGANDNENENDKKTSKTYEIYFSHQCDNRTFNRGATKNIGFLAIKQKYPDDYKDITFVFNDIDTIPFSNIIDFQTTHGIVKHFYGFEYALGGIVSITGSDFEATNGYPNFWGWGMEDTVLQHRCQRIGLHINRDQFFPIGSPEILHLFDGVSRLINVNDSARANTDNGYDGIRTIHNLRYNIDVESMNPLDNIHMVDSNNILMINIETFNTSVDLEYEKQRGNFLKYDLRENPNQMINNHKANRNNQIQTNDANNTNNQNNTNDEINEINNNNWTHIPFVPTSEKKSEMIQKYGANAAQEIIDYSYENSVDPNTPVIPPHLQQMQQLAQQRQMQQLAQQFNSRTRVIPQNINKFSSAYSRILGINSKAKKSANIKLGGIF